MYLETCRTLCRSWAAFDGCQGHFSLERWIVLFAILAQDHYPFLLWIRAYTLVLFLRTSSQIWLGCDFYSSFPSCLCDSELRTSHVLGVSVPFSAMLIAQTIIIHPGKYTWA